ncbi:MAG: hypothetical protein K940chlam2_01110, partial [Chlamydiae bacterium]|nr:hypothetical protein [Chlamydiota bacterium]
SQGSGASAAAPAATPPKPAPAQLSWSERQTIRSLQQKVTQFRKIYNYLQEQAASTKLAAELKGAEAKLTGEARAIVTDLIAQCSAHMQLHMEMQRAVAGIEPVNTYPPIGLANSGANCWANAFLQTLVNADVDTSASAPLQTAQEGYRAAQLQGSLFAQGVASQKIREAHPTASNRSVMQEDVATAFEHFLSTVKLDVPIEEKIETRVRGRDGELTQATTTTRTTRESLLKFPIVAGQDFEALLGTTFKYDSEDDHGFDVKLMEAPKNLFLQAIRFNYGAGAGKNNGLIQNGPEMFVMPQEYVKDSDGRELYELRSCVLHLGDSLNSGHYVTLVKKPSGWYLVNDAQTRKVEDDELPSLLAQGYIFHYAKAE